MRKNEPIKHVMSNNVHTVQQGQAVSEVYELMHSNHIHHVPVLNGEKLVGIVSSTDLMKLSMGVQGYEANQMWSFLDSQFLVVDLMTADPHTLHETDVVRDAAEMLSKGNYHCLPVTDEEQHLVGMVTTTDLIQYLCAQYS